ncbi:hypothetical protein HPHPP11B_0097 [Helicobacter pylori Hp P-11b]|uniref:Uncharacterized protein n=1 Tax=Helicobacter pylori Hp P-11b TaxID=992106 RepID=J0S5M8_HELPX|nr:hypothetical protein HPHPP11_0040 [Helicobacter pylori Hp P-11]EJC30796.1 hypothetical protein HPHPP11B_0097 [Helicobacter pylori Hp P-11b]
MLVSVSFGVLKRLCFSQVLINLIRIQCFFCLKISFLKNGFLFYRFRSHFVVKIISLSFVLFS